MCRFRRRPNATNFKRKLTKVGSEASSSASSSCRRVYGGYSPDWNSNELAEVEIECDDFMHYSLTVPLIWGERIDKTSIILWKLPKELSQSKLCGRPKTSSACTLIALKVAEYMYRKRLLFNTSIATGNGELERRVCPPQIVNALFNAIIDGNHAYELGIYQFSSSQHYFSIPEALCATGKQFHEIQYCDMTGSIQRNLAVHLRAALESPITREFKQLFFLLLVFERSVLLVAQRHNNTIAIVDSHAHFDYGSYIACGQLDQLEEFTKFLADYVFCETRFMPKELQCFELSLLQFRAPVNSNDCPMDELRPPINLKRPECVFPEVSQHLRPNKYFREALEALREGDAKRLDHLLRIVRLQSIQYRIGKRIRIKKRC